MNGYLKDIFPIFISHKVNQIWLQKNTLFSPLRCRRYQSYLSRKPYTVVCITWWLCILYTYMRLYNSVRYFLKVNQLMAFSSAFLREKCLIKFHTHFDINLVTMAVINHFQLFSILIELINCWNGKTFLLLRNFNNSNPLLHIIGIRCTDREWWQIKYTQILYAPKNTLR